MVKVNTILFSKLRCISVKKKIVLVCFLKEYMPFEMKLSEERNVCVLQLSSKNYELSANLYSSNQTHRYACKSIKYKF